MKKKMRRGGSLQVQNPFKYIQILDKINTEVQAFDSTVEDLNALYCPENTQYVIDLAKDLPLVSAVIVPLFKYGTPRASTALVECYFKNFNNRIYF